MTVTKEIAMARAQTCFGSKVEVLDARKVAEKTNRVWQVKIKVGCVAKWVRLPSTAATRKALQARNEPLGAYANASKRRPKNKPNLRLVESHEVKAKRMAKLFANSQQRDEDFREAQANEHQIDIQQNVYHRNTIPCLTFDHLSN